MNGVHGMHVCGRMPALEFRSFVCGVGEAGESWLVLHGWSHACCYLLHYLLYAYTSKCSVPQHHCNMGCLRVTEIAACACRNSVRCWVIIPTEMHDLTG